MNQPTPSFSFDVTSADFDKLVVQASFDQPVLVDFWAEWCAPCKVMLPILEQIAEDYQGELLLAKVNCDVEQDIVGRIGIQTLPTVVLFKDGKVVANSAFKLTATEVTVKVVYSGWQPSFESKEAFYDPTTHEKLVNTEKVIAGVKYKFDASGKPTVVDTSNGLVKGIDVSKYQYNIDWNAVKASGIDFAIIRVGYRGYGTGALVEDPYFRQNIKGANAAGVKVGLYFYSQAINEQEAVDEASMVIRMIQETGGRVSYPIYFDTEKVAGDTGRADGISRDQRTRNAVAFCNAIQNAGYRAGVYSYASWFYNNLNMASLTGYSIWIAQYRDQLDFKYNYDIWQYTSSGVVPGISTRVDMNVSKLG